jgi:hypothetical protein
MDKQNSAASLRNCRASSPNVWADAGRMMEAAHRTPLPVGWTTWTALVLLPVILICFLA